MNDEKLFTNELNEIVIMMSDTKEVLSVIPNKFHENEIIQAKGIDILFNYSDKPKEYIGKNGKVYLKEVWK